MNKSKSIGVNAVLNVIRQGLSVIFPLITYPYALRMLGAESIGKVSYAQSIVSYFSLIAMLGVSSYAIREGAKRRSNSKEFNQFSNEIFTINVITTVIAYVLLLSCLLFLTKLKEYRLLILLVSISIGLSTLGIDWMNTIYEDYLLITIRSIVVHLVSLILLFIFVHKKSDYYIYAALTVVSNGIICATNWVHCKKYANIRLTFHPNIKKHLKPLLILFANALAVSIYVNFDMTMLGWIKGDYSVGLYSVAVKIYTIVKNLLIAAYSVSIPRLAYYLGNQKQEEFKNLYTDLWGYMAVILVPASVGLICVSPEVMYIMGGKEFADAALSLQLLGGALFFAIFGGLTTACLNVTIGREKENLIATILGATINLVLNFIFIPQFNHYGAAFTTMISEAFVFLFCFIRIPSKDKYLNNKKVLYNLFSVLIGSSFIAILCVIISNTINDIVIGLLMKMFCSSIVYLITLLVLKNAYVIDGLLTIKKKIRGKMT